jgi:hypothetical protein
MKVGVDISIIKSDPESFCCDTESSLTTPLLVHKKFKGRCNESKRYTRWIWYKSNTRGLVSGAILIWDAASLGN